MTIRIMLDEDGFRRLVRGETIETVAESTATGRIWTQAIEIALADIGFERIAEIVIDSAPKVVTVGSEAVEVEIGSPVFYCADCGEEINAGCPFCDECDRRRASTNVNRT